MNWENLGRAAQKACREIGQATAEFCAVANTELGNAISSFDEQQVKIAHENGAQVTKQYVDFAVSIGAHNIARVLRGEHIH